MKLRPLLMAATAILLVASCARKDKEPKAEKPGETKAGETATAAATTAAPTSATTGPASKVVRPPKDPYPSTYRPWASNPTLITGATILTGDGERINNGAIVIENGRITNVGAADAVNAPQGAIRIPAAGKWVTPGLIDIHSHLGVYPSPGTESTSDGNEATAPVTAQVWAEHSVWPQDPGFTRALAGGVTTMQILPGSANLVGGRSVILKNVPGRTVQEMKFPGAPYGLKMACGENPKRVYGEKGGPSTRMANFAGYRQAWIEAAEYKKKWEDYSAEAAKFYGEDQPKDDAAAKGEKKKPAAKAKSAEKKSDDDKKPPEPPSRDLRLETLAGALSGEIAVNMHCYRADEMALVLDMAREFGYRVATFHHGVEAYKIADLLAENGVCGALWADWWGFKLESYDAVRENIALVDAQENGCAIVHSDSAIGIQRLNQEAAKAMADGNRMGLKIPEERAIKWLTSNPAKAMRIADRTGTLEAGKAADLVIWSGNPFSVYAKAERVFIDGALMYDRADPKRSPRTDFELGQLQNGFTGGSGQ